MVTYLIIVGREGQFGRTGNEDGRMGEKGQEREGKGREGWGWGWDFWSFLESGSVFPN